MNREKYIVSLLAILFVFMAAPILLAFEAEFKGGPVTLEADKIDYDGDEDAFHASGNVLITFSGGYLKTDSATLNRATNEALAIGHVKLQSDRDILEGEKVVFNVVTKTGTVDDGRIFVARNHIYIKGEKIEKKSDAAYRIENATATTCDGEKPDWRIAGRELDVTIDGYGVLKHGRFLVRDIPVFYVPYLIFPAKTTRQTGLLFPRLARSNDINGIDVEIPFYWAVSDSADATFFQRYLEKRGFKEGVEFRYAMSPDSFGLFYGDFINDRKRVTQTVGDLSRDWQDDRNRWSYYLNHETAFANGIGLRSDIRRVSDPWYFRDFSTSNYYRDNYSPTGEDQFRRVSFFGDESLGSLDSTVRMTKDWSLYNLTALARYTDDFSSSDNGATLQKYPEVTLSGFRQPLFDSPLQIDFSAGYDHLYRSEGQKGHLWNISPTIYLPRKLGSFHAVPWAGFRGDLWDRSDSVIDSGDPSGDREVFAFGTSLSTEVARVFDLKGTKVEKIRHGIRPEIAYTFIPEASQDDAPDFLERISPRNTLAYGITNTLIARMREKNGKIGYREMMRFRVGQTCDIREARRDTTVTGTDNRPFGDVDIEMDLALISYLSFSSRNKYNVNSGGWRQNNYDLTLSDNRGDSASAGYRYTRDMLEEVNLYLKAALTPSLQATYVLRRNQFDEKTIEATYGLQYRRQCWNVEFSVSDRQDDRTVTVLFSLYGMGK